MSKHTVKINEQYFADLGTRYKTEFSNVNDAFTYAIKTNNLEHGNDNVSKLSNTIKNYQNSLDYDITCISSVFSSTDADMKKRASDLIGDKILTGVAGGGEITVDYYDIKPTRDTPRKLEKTTYGYTKDSDGNLIYDHPVETEKYLYRNQGDAYKEYQGTCGLCTIANMLRLAGVNVDEKTVVDYAVKHGLCTAGDKPGYNGGTTPSDRKKILEHFGVKCSLKPCNHNSQQTINDIADYVSSGRGVNIAVTANVLDKRYGDGTHSIVVTSVKKDADGNVLGFFVCDSNSGMPSYYTADRIKKAVYGAKMLVTDSPIR